MNHSFPNTMTPHFGVIHGHPQLHSNNPANVKQRTMWPRRVFLTVVLALAALLIAIIDRQETFEPSQRRLSNQNVGSLNGFADPKSSSLRSGTITKTYMDLVDDDVPLPQYSIKSVIQAANLVQSRYLLLRYDPAKRQIHRLLLK
jgi:hypothetical protein